jgi:2-C-methyl-D-erythritol 4-phosphate cytidylyltransferase / 2-C-methyl-D-erythritol 2,4-cyclodiphosphate synthase
LRDPGSTPGVDAIVVAAGSSSRMGGRDKLAALVAGRPLLAWTLAALSGSSAVERIVVVTGADRLPEIVGARWLPASVVAVVAGAERRQGSVAAGLAALEALDGPDVTAWSDRVVLVHDGARPFVSADLVAAVAAAADRHGAAIPVVPVAETLKRIDGDRIVGTVDRSSLAAAQTPQGVRRGLLRHAFDVHPPHGEPTWTDEAALLEACRIAVHVVPGDPRNLKVTVPADLDRVAAGLGSAHVLRPVIGHDSHPFGPGEPLALGGIEIPRAPRLYGHSDGDVALHAVCDALLGATGLGDLGRLFPPGPETPRGVASTELVRTVVERIAGAGWRPVSVDLTIVAARPRLAPYLDEMRAAIAGLLQIPPPAVNVKASTGNLAGMEGAGRGVSAHAVVAVEVVP